MFTTPVDCHTALWTSCFESASLLFCRWSRGCAGFVHDFLAAVCQPEHSTCWGASVPARIPVPQPAHFAVAGSRRRLCLYPVLLFCPGDSAVGGNILELNVLCREYFHDLVHLP